jgi:hypothetical protein
MDRNDPLALMFVQLVIALENGMKRLGVFGATALSLSLVIATPVLAQQPYGKAAGGHAGAGMGARAGGANVGGARMGGPRMGNVGAQANFRGAQTNVGRSNFVGRGNGQFAQGGYRGGEFRGDRGQGYGRNIAAGAVAAGVAAGSAIAIGNNYGYYNDGYYDPNSYGDSYAYDGGVTYNTGIPLVTFDQGPGVVGYDETAGDPAFCAQRYRSYDPASGTYLGFDGLRHPCP